MKYKKGDVILFLAKQELHSMSYCIGIRNDVLLLKDVCAKSYKPTGRTLYVDINHPATTKNLKFFHWEE